MFGYIIIQSALKERNKNRLHSGGVQTEDRQRLKITTYFVSFQVYETKFTWVANYSETTTNKRTHNENAQHNTIN